MILYLHGFRSSPQSHKATLMAQAMQEKGLADDWVCPQLSASPKHAVQLANDLIVRAQGDRNLQAESQLTVIGSSLGGFYATCLAERWNCRAVLLNPVVHAAQAMATQVGEHKQYHCDEPFSFLPEYIQELADMAVDRPAHPERYFLLAATGDELLDWRQMADWYAGSQGHVINGSDHGLSDFQEWLPDVMAFALARH